jgi:hypothetical protein
MSSSPARLKIGKPAIIELTGGKLIFHIIAIRRFLSIGNTYWIIDEDGIKFKIFVLNKNEIVENEIVENGD